MPRPLSELRHMEEEERRRAKAHRRLVWQRRWRVVLWILTGLVVLAMIGFVLQFGRGSIG